MNRTEHTRIEPRQSNRTVRSVFINRSIPTDHLVFTGLRNKVVSELRKAKTNYFSKLIEEANGNSSKLWQHINKLTNSSKHKHPKITSLKVGNTLIHSNESIANVFNSFFIESVQELASHFKATESSTKEFDNAQSDSFYIKLVSHDKVERGSQT